MNKCDPDEVNRLYDEELKKRPKIEPKEWITFDSDVAYRNENGVVQYREFTPLERKLLNEIEEMQDYMIEKDVFDEWTRVSK